MPLICPGSAGLLACLDILRQCAINTPPIESLPCHYSLVITVVLFCPEVLIDFRPTYDNIEGDTILMLIG